jgi:MFS family permease
MSRVMWFFAIVYAVEGIGQAKAGILGQPLTYFLKETQHWDPVHISVSLSVLDIPWVIKPLWGIISDFVPLFGYRRRPYLVLANIAGVLAFIGVAMATRTSTLIPMLTVTAIAMAVSSTLCGALLVETGQRHHASARFVNQQWLWFNISQMLSVLLAGYLLDVLPPSGALHVSAWIAAAAPLTILASVWLVSEPRAGGDAAALRTRLAALGAAVKEKNLWFVAGFLFLYYFSPGFGTPLYFEMTDRLHFSQGFIGLLSSIGSVGWILGGVLYHLTLRRWSQPALLRFSIIGGVLSTLLYLLLRDPISAVVIWVLTGMAAMIAMIATMSLAAEACPQGAEGFAFAGLMSLLNVAQPASDALGSVLYEHVFNQRLTPLIIVSAAATGLVYLLTPLVRFAPEATAVSVDD